MASNSERQAAYRRRKQAVIDELFSMRGLPTLPAISTIPGWSRWKEAMTRIAGYMEMIEVEMTQYGDERSDRWHESDQADTFSDRTEALRQLIDGAHQWPE